MKKCDIIEISDKEKKLLKLLKEIGYGEVVIFLQDGQPIRVEETKKSIKL